MGIYPVKGVPENNIIFLIQGAENHTPPHEYASDKKGLKIVNLNKKAIICQW